MARRWMGLGRFRHRTLGPDYSSLLLLVPTTVGTTATVILLMATATAILLTATDIVALTMAAIIRAIGTPVTPIVGPIMDTPAIPIVDRPRDRKTILKRPPSGGLFRL